MANVIWVGKQSAVPQDTRVTVTAAPANATFTLTVSGKARTFTYAAGTSTADAASKWAADLEASEEGEFAELTYTSSGSALVVTGPDDGAPFTVSASAGAGGTITGPATTAGTPKSPHDVNDGLNWSGGAVPTAVDVAVFENSDVDALYNLAALTAVAFGVIRRATFAGRIGLPDTDEQLGYREYRATHLETAGTSIQVEQAPGDDAGQVRVRATAAGAVTVTVTGSGAPGAPGSEPVEVYGLAGASVVNVANAGVAVGPETTRPATVATVRGVNATVRLGPAVTVTTVNLTGCEALVLCSYTTLTVDRGGTVEVAGAAAGTTTEVEEGTALWKSTGNFGALTVGSDGTFDLSQAPSAIAPSSALTVNEGGTLLDPAERLTRPYSLNLTRTQQDRVTLDLGTHYQLDVKAHP